MAGLLEPRQAREHRRIGGIADHGTFQEPPRLARGPLVAPQRYVCVRQSTLAVSGLGLAERGQPITNASAGCGLRLPEDAVIGDGGVADVGALHARHVAGRAVWPLDVMSHGERAVTLQALPAVVLGARRRFGLHVRVVAREARHPVAAVPLAGADGQRLHVADRAAGGVGSVGDDEDRDGIGEPIPRPEIGQRSARARDPRLAFEMTLGAETVSRGRIQGRGIDHVSASGDVLASGTVAALAADPFLTERLTFEAVRRAVLRHRDLARMAEQAGLVDHVVERHAGEIRVAGRHVPDTRAGVVVDRRLVEETIDREEERPAARVRPDEVLQRHAAGDAPAARALEGQRRLVAFSVDAVPDARAGMREGTLDQASPRGPARPRHGRSNVGVVDLAVAGPARCVADFSRRLSGNSRGGRGGYRRRNQTDRKGDAGTEDRPPPRRHGSSVDGIG